MWENPMLIALLQPSTLPKRPSISPPEKPRSMEEGSLRFGWYQGFWKPFHSCLLLPALSSLGQSDGLRSPEAYFVYYFPIAAPKLAYRKVCTQALAALEEEVRVLYSLLVTSCVSFRFHRSLLRRRR